MSLEKEQNEKKESFFTLKGTTLMNAMERALDEFLSLRMERIDGFLSHRQPANLRDQFAMAVVSEMIRLSLNKDGFWEHNHVAMGAYEMADAMLKARESKA